jgi:hypothetical protein
VHKEKGFNVEAERRKGKEVHKEKRLRGGEANHNNTQFS